MPKRIQLRRAKGWRMPENAVKVDRSTKWGNLFTVVSVGTREKCLEVFSDLIKRGPCLGYLADAWPSVKMQEERRAHILANLDQLRGKDLACWCPLDQPCHADVLLQLANALGEAGDG